MEPFDIDKIIKEKASENHGLHQREIDAARPFVWSEIQRKEGHGQSLTWVHLTAAVLFLMLCFSMVLIKVQKNHKREMENLSAKLDRIQTEYTVQTEALEMKTNQIASLTKQQMALNKKLSDIKTTPAVHREQIVYRTDTVLIKQVEYITRVAEPLEPMEQSMEKEAFLKHKTTNKTTKSRKVDDIIFPSHQSKNKPPETLRVKFGSLASNRN